MTNATSRRTLIAAGLALGASALPQPAGAVLRGAPELTVDALHDAMARGDREAVLALLAEDVVIYEQGGIERSRAEYESHHLGHDIEFAKATSKRLVNRSGKVAGDMAWVISESRVTGTIKDKPLDLSSLETAVLRRSGQGWLVVHLHWSSGKNKAA